MFADLICRMNNENYCSIGRLRFLRIETMAIVLKRVGCPLTFRAISNYTESFNMIMMRVIFVFRAVVEGDVKRVCQRRRGRAGIEGRVEISRRLKSLS